MDSNPLAADPAPVIADNQDDFVFGLHALTRLTDGQVFVCYRDGTDVPGHNVPNVTLEAFAGPHPSGLAWTHIHHLDPVGGNKVVWYLGYQDVIAIGSLITTGRLETDRVISLAGPGVKQPRLLRTRLGACIDELTADQIETEPAMRVISGSVLAGHKSQVPCNYLGRYHQQISVLPEGEHREFLGWQKPGFNTFSASRTFARSLVPGGGLLKLNTSLGGSRRAMVPIGAYEKVMPMDMLPTQLLRALIVGDTEQAQLLGCLELDEEDLALCTFVCPSKYEYGPLLRENLKKIEVEG
jgi:Na+-transporting NADH:ubiquinone oxidoreductase subunit A